ncbi:glycosyltransferase family 2 protein [Listeria rocourtiae]|uniref:glycosyltransferase family 2 protein n=1 Tax=Listeria rocourtiae TaxID=647910 RepID=UPI00162A73C2|nr:glycosyltransferase family A protein [Listeria rocourtiae]MBC1605512.1 glycosyltransferase family 2 protein [Listeria rocourtiae]
MGLVSVVIPTRHRVDFLVRAVESVMRQTYPNVEIWIVVDGEDADTLAYLSQLGPTRFPVYYVQTSGIGGSAARNLGVAKSSGKWVAFLDDDDAFLPDKIACQWEQLRYTLDDFHLSFCPVLTNSLADQETFLQVPMYDLNAESLTVAEFIFCKKGRRTLGFIQTSTLFGTRELFREIPFTDGLVKHQDWDLLLRMAQQDVQFHQLEEAKTRFYRHDAPSVGNTNAWAFSDSWIQQMEISKLARDYFMLSIVLRGVAKDSTLSKSEKHGHFKRKIRDLTWQKGHYFQFLRLIFVNFARIYIKG